MEESKSGAMNLSSRLKATNGTTQFSLSNTMSSAPSLKPRLMMSQSTPGLLAAPHSKVTKLREQTGQSFGASLKSTSVVPPMVPFAIGSEASIAFSTNRSQTSLADTRMTLTRSSSVINPFAACSDEISKALLENGCSTKGFVASLNLSTSQLYDLFKVPHTFFYLRQCELKQVENELGEDIASSNVSVYDLENVPLDLIDNKFYFTLSKEGVTQFQNKTSSFTTLSQYEREFLLFNKISKIRFFKVYKRWKVRDLPYSLIKDQQDILLPCMLA